MRLEIDPSSTAFPLANHDIGDDAFALSSYDFGSLVKKGIAAAQSGERDQARKLLSQATAINPASEDAWMWLASISDYPEELLAFLNRVLEINPANGKAAEWRTATNSLLAKTFVQRALAARNDGRFEHASQCLDQALACDNRCETAWYWKASLAVADEEKLELFEHVLTINPSNAEAAAAIARIRESQVAARLHEARLCVQSDPDRAIELLSGLADHPSPEVRESAWMLMAETSEDEDHKMDCYARVLDVNAENHEAAAAVEAITSKRAKAVLDNARAAAVGGDRGLALSMLDEFVQNNSGSADAWLLKSHLSESLSDKIEALEKALEIEPGNAAARSGLEYLSLTFGPSQQSAPVETKSEEPTEAASASYVPASLDTFQQEQVDSAVEFASRPTEESIRLDESPSLVSQWSDDGQLSVVRMDGPTADQQEMEYAQLAGDYFAMANSNESVDAGSEHVNAVADELEDSFGLDNGANPFEPEAPASPFDLAAEHAEPQAYDQVFAPSTLGCVFCGAANEAQAFQCYSCLSTLTLSDLEGLLSGTDADVEVLQHAVTSMEAEWNLREFSEEEFTWLAIGHLNLGNFESGLRYLQEASRLNPNNVILTGQVNTLAIRINEIRQQNETHVAVPKGKTILVVDDSATVRKLIAGKLEKSGHNVICAIDGVEALARIDEGMPDLVLLDITMPRMDGYEVCKQIRANPLGKDLPVVMISGKDGFFDKVRGRMAGTTGYVTKPFGPETLMKALETYLIPDAVEAA
jgi:twitching motility two-component system response regulator PilG